MLTGLHGSDVFETGLAVEDVWGCTGVYWERERWDLDVQDESFVLEGAACCFKSCEGGVFGGKGDEEVVCECLFADGTSRMVRRERDIYTM